MMLVWLPTIILLLLGGKGVEIFIDNDVNTVGVNAVGTDADNYVGTAGDDDVLRAKKKKKIRNPVLVSTSCGLVEY